MPIDYKCIVCVKDSSREVTWISPKKFSGPAVMKISFWCSSCEEPNIMNVKFLTDGTIKFVSMEHNLDPTIGMVDNE